MDDRQMVREIQQGNTGAIALFISSNQQLVGHMVSRVVDNDEDREELCQDVFIKALDKIGTFSFESKLSTWLATIAYRHAINFIRKKSKKQPMEDLDQVAFHLETPEKGFENTDFSHFIHGLIDQMPEQYRIVLTLFYLESFSYPEIVEITGMPEGTVKNYLFRARQKLKDLATPYIGIEIHDL